MDGRARPARTPPDDRARGPVGLHEARGVDQPREVSRWAGAPHPRAHPRVRAAAAGLRSGRAAERTTAAGGSKERATTDASRRRHGLGRPREWPHEPAADQLLPDDQRDRRGQLPGAGRRDPCPERRLVLRHSVGCDPTSHRHNDGQEGTSRPRTSALQLFPPIKRLAVGSRCTWARTIWSRRWAQSFYPLSSAARARTRRPTTFDLQLERLHSAQFQARKLSPST